LIATFIEVPERKKVMNDLVRICNQFDINIKLPGNTNFDPKKPDATDLIEDFFPQKIGTKCGLPNAFLDFKRNERDCLELNAERN
jgi:hypothetical protein